ncbi:TPA: hypothetical protein CPT96_01700 [Candidatus Gastranaerophilales bacterium HUM_10]|nr:MAG TPA: hypothetical protein CPT96_01700 [Candidatus Gastranaerophilales bacterium HUM_10]
MQGTAFLAQGSQGAAAPVVHGHGSTVFWQGSHFFSFLQGSHLAFLQGSAFLAQEQSAFCFSHLGQCPQYAGFKLDHSKAFAL